MLAQTVRIQDEVQPDYLLLETQFLSSLICNRHVRKFPLRRTAPLDDWASIAVKRRWFAHHLCFNRADVF